MPTVPARFSRRLCRLAGAAGLACLVATAGLIGGVAPVAVAAPLSAAAPPPNNISWAVTPSTANGPDGRSHFSYTDIKPGGVMNDYVGITNYSTKSVTFNVYASDGVTTTSGSIGLASADQKNTNVGAWIHPLHNLVSVPPRSRLNEPFTLVVPANATPGDHVGGVIASVSQAKQGGKVNREDRVGVALYLRVAGPLHSALGVEQLSANGYHGTVNPFGGGGTTVTYTVRNNGNVRLAGDQTVSVTGLFGIPLATIHPTALQEVLPGDSVRVTAHVSGVFPAGPLTVHVRVTPVEVPGSPHLTVASQAGEGSVDMWAAPWPQLVLLVLLAAIGFGIWRWLRWRRSHRAAALAAAVERGRREATEQLATVGAKDGGDRAPKAVDPASDPE